MKDEYHANRAKPAPNPTEVKKDGFLNSDSEDERIVREHKRKTAPDSSKQPTVKSTKYTAAA